MAKPDTEWEVHTTLLFLHLSLFVCHFPLWGYATPRYLLIHFHTMQDLARNARRSRRRTRGGASIIPGALQSPSPRRASSRTLRGAAGNNIANSSNGTNGVCVCLCVFVCLCVCVFVCLCLCVLCVHIHMQYVWVASPLLDRLLSSSSSSSSPTKESLKRKRSEEDTTPSANEGDPAPSSQPSPSKAGSSSSKTWRSLKIWTKPWTVNTPQIWPIISVVAAGTFFLSMDIYIKRENWTTVRNYNDLRKSRSSSVTSSSRALMQELACSRGPVDSAVDRESASGAAWVDVGSSGSGEWSSSRGARSRPAIILRHFVSLSSKPGKPVSPSRSSAAKHYNSMQHSDNKTPQTKNQQQLQSR